MPKQWSHDNDPVIARIGLNASKGSSGKEAYVKVTQCLTLLQAEFWFGIDMMLNWSNESGVPCCIDVGDIILRWNNTDLTNIPVAALRKIISEQKLPPALVIRKQVDHIKYLDNARKAKRKIANMSTDQIANQRDRHIVENMTQEYQAELLADKQNHR